VVGTQTKMKCPNSLSCVSGLPETGEIFERFDFRGDQHRSGAGSGRAWHWSFSIAGKYFGFVKGDNELEGERGNHLYGSVKEDQGGSIEIAGNYRSLFIARSHLRDGGHIDR
jgi:hypothetical protein